jgi:hypothetical protein
MDDTDDAALDVGPHIWPFWTATHCLPGITSMTNPGSRCGFGIVYQHVHLKASARDDADQPNTAAAEDVDDGHTWWQDSFIDRSPGPASPVQASVTAVLKALDFALNQCELLSIPAHTRSTRPTVPKTILVIVDSDRALERIDAAWHDHSMHTSLGRTSQLRSLVRTIKSLGALGVKVQLRTTLGIRKDIRNRWARRTARRALRGDSWTERPTIASLQRVCRRGRRAKPVHRG